MSMAKLDPKKVKYLVVHTAAHNGDASAKEIRRWHVEERGWSDIGYHFVIRKDGKLEVGRSLEYQGAHVQGINGQSIGVCCTGNGDAAPFTPEQVETLLALAVRIHKNYGIPTAGLIGHREVNGLIGAGLVPARYATTKSCPGRLVHMPRLRRLFAYLVDPPPSPDIAPVPKPEDTIRLKAA